MKTVGLISGGKDSTFNLMQCVAQGHEIVALANLRPQEKDELDSYMYQTVGYQAINLFAEAIGLPLFQRVIQGTALDTGKDYLPTEADEVEDLYQLLMEVKANTGIEAVAVGAVLSDYQRVRVENVCLRLGLTPLAYLWQRNQAELLQEMVDCGIDAVLIKVAALGLEPSKHLGLPVKQILPHMLQMEKKYGLNVCGEGGEYETFTLDCPLFNKQIVVDEKEYVVHSDDAFAPVGFIRFKKLHLEDKNEKRPFHERLKDLPLTTSDRQISAVTAQVTDTADSFAPEWNSLPDLSPLSGSIDPSFLMLKKRFSISGIVALTDSDVTTSTQQALDALKGKVTCLGQGMSDLFCVCLYLQRMADFMAVNSVYKTYFSSNPPVRVCVQARLPSNVLLQLDCQGISSTGVDEGVERRCMHIQGISHWAPANIGPYSQAVAIDSKVYIAGQIALVPGTMQLIRGNAAMQSRLSLHHVASILSVMCPDVHLQDTLLAVCYVTHSSFIAPVSKQWQEMSRTLEQEDIIINASRRFTPLVEYVVIPALPRDAEVEWQVYVPALPVEISENEIRLESGKLKAECRCLTSRTNTHIFASRTQIIYADGDLGNIDCHSAVTLCLDCYSAMMNQVNKEWGNVLLLRVFYSANICSYDLMWTVWQESLKHFSTTPPVVVLVPVIQLGDLLCMSVCH